MPDTRHLAFVIIKGCEDKRKAFAAGPTKKAHHVTNSINLGEDFIKLPQLLVGQSPSESHKSKFYMCESPGPVYKLQIRRNPLNVDCKTIMSALNIHYRLNSG